jgi:hypothetical protein
MIAVKTAHPEKPPSPLPSPGVPGEGERAGVCHKQSSRSYTLARYSGRGSKAAVSPRQGSRIFTLSRYSGRGQGEGSSSFCHRRSNRMLSFRSDTQAGYRVLRVSNDDLLNDLDAV